MESGGFSLSRLIVRNANGPGIEIEKPPVQVAPRSRISGVSARIGGTVPRQTPRKKRFDPIKPLPFGNADLGTKIFLNQGPGIYIHSGARDILIQRSSISGNNGPGIHLRNTGPSIYIEGNEIGTSGEFGANQGHGILIEDNSAEDVFIGSGPFGGNRITGGNGKSGIHIVNSSGIAIENNWILGHQVLGTRHRTGVWIENSNDIIVGSQNPHDGNLIRGASEDGIFIRGFPAGLGGPILIGMNFLGVEFTGNGNDATKNGRHGIYAQGNQSLGRIIIQANLIGGSGGSGVRLENWAQNSFLLVADNIIGKAIWDCGVAGIPVPAPFGLENAKGIQMVGVSGVRIVRNLISANTEENVLLQDAQRNNLTSNCMFSAGTSGIQMEGSSSQNELVQNEIAGNAQFGVRIIGNQAQRNRLTITRIWTSGGKGISLEEGANNWPPFWNPVVGPMGIPFLSKIERKPSGKIRIEGWARLFPDGSTVELFADYEDEGQCYLGATQVAGGWFWLEDIQLPPACPDFQNLKFHCLVTDPEGNTSEFCDYEELPLDECGTLNRDCFLEQVVASVRNGDLSLTQMDSRQSEAVTSTGMDSEPDVCLDDQNTPWMAFTSRRDGNPEIYVLNLKTNTLTRLTNDPADDLQPAFSPDCQEIAFSSNRDGNYEIYRISRNGGTPTRLTTHPAVDRDPEWDADGTKILFSSARNGNYALFQMDAAGGNVSQVASAPGVHLLSPAWLRGTATSSVVVLRCENLPPNAQPCRLALLDPSTGSLQVLPDDGYQYEGADWVVYGRIALLVVSRKLAQAPGPYRLVVLTTRGTPVFPVSPADLPDTTDDRSPACCLPPQ